MFTYMSFLRHLCGAAVLVAAVSAQPALTVYNQDFAMVRERVLAGGTDEEVLAWITARGRPLADADRLIWNGFAAKRGWRDDATPTLERQKAESGLAHRADLMTFFDYYEVDEGRAPR